MTKGRPFHGRSFFVPTPQDCASLPISAAVIRIGVKGTRIGGGVSPEKGNHASAAPRTDDVVGPSVPGTSTSAKSPRSVFSAVRSRLISSAVRNPRRRRIASGGHHPSITCCTMKQAATAGKRYHLRFENVPSAIPARTTLLKLSSSTALDIPLVVKFGQVIRQFTVSGLLIAGN